jgi:hypothetical protein
MAGMVFVSLLSFFNFYRRGIILFLHHFYYLFNKKMDGGLGLKMIANSGLKFGKFETVIFFFFGGWGGDE